MWMFGTVVFVCSLTVYGEEKCESGKYGDGCVLDCPKNCHLLPNTSFYCKKEDGKCAEGCKVGFYGDICKEACSRNCKGHVCYQHNGHCTDCIENHIGDFCEITQDPTPGPTGTSIESHTTVTTVVAPTSRSSAENVGIQVIIPVVVVTVLALVGSGCTVIILKRCRKRSKYWNQDMGHDVVDILEREIPDPEGQELLACTDDREDTELHIACKRGNVDEVKSVLSDSLTNINSRGLYGWTPLMAAARYGRRDVFDFLVSKGCDTERVDDFGNNILHVACLGGDLKLVKSILSKEIAGLNSRGHRGRTPIMAAARMGHTYVLKTLLSMECDSSLVDEDGNNILHYACIGGHHVVVQYILDNDIVDINSKGKHDMTPVMISLEVGHKQVFDILVQKGAHPSQVDRNGNNILHLACIEGNVKMANHILSQDVIDINSRGQDGRTSVMAAAECRCTEVFELLVRKGADLSLVDNYSNNVLHVTCSRGNVNMVKDVLAKDSVDINSRGQNGRTPLMWAILGQNNEVIDILVSKGADTLLVDNDSNNILHHACIGGHLVAVQHILNKNIVDINSKGKHGKTPVMLSVEAGHRHVFDCFVHKGADLSQVDKNGNNILHLACLSGHVVIVKDILYKSIVDINSKGQSGRTPLMMAAHAGQRDVFVLLVTKGANTSLVDEHNDNILHQTCRKGQLEFVKFVLAQGIVDIDCTGQHNRTPVMMAVENGHEKVFNVLVNEGANLSSIDDSGNNILHLGCFGGSETIVQYILSKNVIDINAINNDRSTAVTIATEQGHRSISELVYNRN